MTTKPTATATKATPKDATQSTPDITKLIPELVDLLEAGVHFGHERSKRNPKMEQYIFMQRNRVAIIDLEQTREKLQAAARFAAKVGSTPGSELLFVGTKRQARTLVRQYAEKLGQPYVTKRWLGGTLTNFSTILKSIEKLDELKRTADSPKVAKLTKKEKLVRSKEIERLEEVLEGIKDLKSLPAALFVAGTHDERIAVREAQRVGIPVIGITDTNCDPLSVAYPIPANDDAIRSLDLIIGTIARAFATGQGKPVSDIPSQATSVPEVGQKSTEETAQEEDK